MSRFAVRCLFAGTLLIGIASPARADLFTFGPDGTSTPRAFTSITMSGAAAFQFDVGDGSLAFNGGLTFVADQDLFFAIANDFTGASFLMSFSGTGSLTTVASLGSGFLGGLTYNPADGNFYAIASDMFGNSLLTQISPSGVATDVGAIGVGFFGGLTFNPLDGLLYAISGDAFGVQRSLSSITTGGVVTSLFALGDGSLAFDGGLAVNPSTGAFFIVSSDFLGTSTLNTFSLGDGGASLAAVGGAFGQGFSNRGLVDATVAPVPVPEPGTLTLTATVMLALFAVRRFV